jgi:hypothetical protein
MWAITVSQSFGPFNPIGRQLIWLLAGTALGASLFFVDYRRLERLAVLSYDGRHASHAAPGQYRSVGRANPPAAHAVGSRHLRKVALAGQVGPPPRRCSC